MGKPYYEVVRVKAHCVSRVENIPLYEPEVQEDRSVQERKFGNNSAVALHESSAHESESVTPMSNGAFVKDAKRFIEGTPVETHQVAQVVKISATKVVLPDL